MYHDYGASKWNLDSSEAFVNFTKKANNTLLWRSDSQLLGSQVIGNDKTENSITGVKG